LFTRFIPPRDVPEADGGRRDFYEKWAGLTRSQVETSLLELMPPLPMFVPPAMVFDEQRYIAQVRSLEVPEIRALWRPFA
jgi:hypothetical protein